MAVGVLTAQSSEQAAPTRSTERSTMYVQSHADTAPITERDYRWYRPDQRGIPLARVLCALLGHLRFVTPRLAVPYVYDNLGRNYCGYCHGRLR